MDEIELILRNNQGNRLTNELIMGLMAMITHVVLQAKQAPDPPTQLPETPSKEPKRTR